MVALPVSSSLYCAWLWRSGMTDSNLGCRRTMNHKNRSEMRGPNFCLKRDSARVDAKQEVLRSFTSCWGFFVCVVCHCVTITPAVTTQVKRSVVVLSYAHCAWVVLFVLLIVSQRRRVLLVSVHKTRRRLQILSPPLRNEAPNVVVWLLLLLLLFLHSINDWCFHSINGGRRETERWRRSVDKHNPVSMRNHTWATTDGKQV